MLQHLGVGAPPMENLKSLYQVLTYPPEPLWDVGGERTTISVLFRKLLCNLVLSHKGVVLESLGRLCTVDD